MAHTDLDYIESSELAEVLEGERRSNYFVIDVRDEGFEEGHVIGAKNVPSSNFKEGETALSQLVEEHANTGHTLVFHCMKSQHRGPTCAKAFIAEASKTLEGDQMPNIKVLRGGYLQWQAHYDGDSTKIGKA